MTVKNRLIAIKLMERLKNHPDIVKKIGVQVELEKKDNNLYEEELDNVILKIIMDIINKRKEPTPYQVLFNGFICKISQLGFDLSSTESFLIDFLKKHDVIELTTSINTDNRAGNYWWIKDKKINQSKTLTKKVERYIVHLFEQYDSIKYEKLMQEIYNKFPNGLTPDYDTIHELINKLLVEKKGIFKRRD